MGTEKSAHPSREEWGQNIGREHLGEKPDWDDELNCSIVWGEAAEDGSNR